MPSRRQGLLRRVGLPAGALRPGRNPGTPFTVAIVDRAGDAVAGVDETHHVRRIPARAVTARADDAERRFGAKA
jgi:hypothetical protein